MDQERIEVLLALLAGDPRCQAGDDAAIMECEWLGGRLPAPPPFQEWGPPCDCWDSSACDRCAHERAYRVWERAWERAWEAVLARIDAGDDSWEDDFHFRLPPKKKAPPA